jgi:hypothetical protein
MIFGDKKVECGFELGDLEPAWVFGVEGVAFSNDDFGDLLVEALKVIDFPFGVFGHEWWRFDFAVMIIPSRIPFMYEFLP